MSTQIKNLAHDLKPFKPGPHYTETFFKWVASIFIVGAVGYIALPLREDAMEHISSNGYHLENVLWFLLSLLGSFGLYQTSIPEKKTSKSLFLAASIFITALLVLAFTHSDQDSLGLAGEMDLWRGRCGFIISIVGVLQGGLLFNWARTGASIQLSTSGFWIGVSSASFACLMMQLVCAHDNTLHLLLWHFLPLLTLIGMGTVVAKKVLRW